MEKEVVHRLFEASADLFPHRIAVQDGSLQVSYAYLNKQADYLAGLLNDHGVTTERVVNVQMSPGADLITAIVAISKAGGVYMPMDKVFSPARYEQIFRNIGSDVLITDEVNWQLLQDTARALQIEFGCVILFKPGEVEVQVISKIAKANKTTPYDLEDEAGAYIILTSGSTGDAKAVLGKRTSLYHYTLWAVKEFQFNGHSRIGLTSQITFDASIMDVWMALSSGALISIPPPRSRENMHRLIHWLEQYAVSSIHFVPSVFRLLTKNLKVNKNRYALPHLKYAMLAGEPLYCKDILNWRAFVKNAEVVNLYGTTETTINNCFHRITEISENPAQIIHVGKPIDNSFILIVKDGRLCRKGELGDVFIKSKYYTKGYFGNPLLTASLFVQNPLTHDRVDIVYKTGDLGRYLEEWNVEILGRKDNQMKVNGIRVELGEIEHAFLTQPGIDEVVLKTIKNEDGESTVIAYYTSAKELDPESVRLGLRTQLNENIIPPYLILMKKFPLNINGKIDKKSLPMPEDLMKADTNYVPVQGETEKKIEQIWKSILSRDIIGRNISFFKVGGQSLKVIQLISQLYKTFEVDLKFIDLYENPTIQQLSALVERSTKKKYLSIAAIEEQEYYPVSNAQRSLWILCQAGANAAYTICKGFVVKGTLSIPVFRQAVEAIFLRHEILRTNFYTKRNEPFQKIGPHVDLEAVFKFQDLSNEPSAREIITTYQRWAEDASFDLATDPLLAFQVFRLAEDNYTLFFRTHHIISDNWSLQVFMNELVAFYASKQPSKSPFTPLPIQYKDYAIWENTMKANTKERDRNYWIDQFPGEIPALNLPLDFPRPPVKTYAGRTKTFQFSEEVSRGVQKYCEDAGTTEYVGLLAAMNVLLFRYTNQSDLIIGSTFSGRDHELLEQQIGFYINTLPLRTRFTPETTFNELIHIVKSNVVEAFEHRAFSFEELISSLHYVRDASHTPLFEILVEMVDAKIIHDDAKFTLTDASVQPIRSESTFSRFDLNFSFQRTDDLRVLIEYNTDLFREASVMRMAAHLEEIISLIIKYPHLAISKMPYRPEDMPATDSSIAAAETISNGSFIQGFEQTVLNNPDAIALAFGDSCFSYECVNEMANRLALHLKMQHAVKPDDIIGVVLNRSERLIIALLGILKSGAGFLPLEPGLSKQWMGEALEDADTRLLITDSEFLFDLSDVYKKNLIALDLQLSGFMESTGNPEQDSCSTDIAYVLYTSGSTGKPKGVAIELRSLQHYVRWANHYYFKNQQGHTFCFFTSISFDLTITSIFTTLWRGDLLVVAENKGVNLLLKDIFTDRLKINTLKLTPSHVSLLHLLNIQKSAVDLVIVGGEELELNHVRSLRNVNLGIRIFNEYGPTEATVGCMVKEVVTEDDITTIGAPIWNTHIFLMDPYFNVLPAGMEGEMVIKSIGLARGYLNKPELTAQMFIQSPDGSEAKIYRSGDAGKLNSLGEIEYKGRIGNQIKLRGYRIDLEYISRVLLRMEGILESKVVLADGSSEDKHLILYWTGKDFKIETLRTYLYQHLPYYMVPSYFVRLESFPLTSNGKTDLLSLPAPIKESVSSFVAPKDEMEKAIATIWEEILDHRPVGMNDNFFALGGNSLKAIQIISCLEREMNCVLELQDVFNFSRLEDFVFKIRKSKQPSRLQRISHIEEQEYYQLSSAQRRLWLMGQLNQNTNAYNIANAYSVAGSMNLSLLEKSFLKVIERHESLRTSFIEVEGEPRQRVHKMEDFRWGIILEDLSSKANEEVLAKGMCDNLIGQPIELSSPPLLKVYAFKLADDRFIILLLMHHILSDGRSSEILFEELLTFYDSYCKELEITTMPLNLQYKDYAAWHFEELSKTSLHNQRAYWLNVFSKEVPLIDLPYDFPRPSLMDFSGERYRFEVTGQEKELLRAISEKQKATSFMALLTVFTIFLSKLSGQNDIVVGTPVMGRSKEYMQDLIGLFINTLALRNSIRGNQSFTELLLQVRKDVLSAYQNQDYQFENLAEDLEINTDASRNPLFDIVFVFEEALDKNAYNRSKSGLAIQPYGLKGSTSKFDLTLFVLETKDGFSLAFEYRSRLFKAATIERFASYFKHVLNQLVLSPDLPLNQLELLLPEDKVLINSVNNTKRSYNETSVPEEFQLQVHQNPDRIAVVNKDFFISYKYLDEWSDLLSCTILNKGAQEEDIVGIFMNPSAERIVAILAVLKAGACYLPLDATLPPQRLRHMVEESNLKTLLVDPSTAGAASFDGVLVSIIKSKNEYPPETVKKKIQKGSLAYVMYTSGTTGMPKGILVEHRSILRLVKNNYFIPMSIESRLLLTGAFGFDATTFEMWGMLLNGGELHLLPQDNLLDSHYLKAYLDTRKITTMWFTSSWFNLLAEESMLVFKQLEWIIVGGEKLSPYYIEKVKDTFPTIHIVNGYGPTENTTFSTTYTVVANETGEIPIGKPIANSTAVILDGEFEKVPVGVKAELFVGGDGLARGYLNQPELTHVKFRFLEGKKLYRSGDFARLRSDGNFEYMGRSDRQIKLRGNRIELDEVENIIRRHKKISDTVVLSLDDNKGESFLVAYVMGIQKEEVESLKSSVALFLPPASIPAFFIPMDRFPLTSNGKVDSKKLPMPISEDPMSDYVAPENGIEKVVTQIWSDLTGTKVDHIGVNTSFFDLGGHSLKVIKMMSQIRINFGRRVSMKDFFRDPTIKGVSKIIQQTSWTIYHEIKKAKPSTFYPLSSAQRRLFVLHEMYPESIAYNMPMFFTIHGTLDVQLLEEALLSLINHHEILRTSFVMQDGTPVQKILEPLNSWKLARRFVGEEAIASEQKMFVSPFDLSQAPLVRTEVISTSKRNVLMVDMPHIISDGMSLSILTRDFAQLLSGKRLKPALLQYKDYATWQHASEIRLSLLEQRKFWATELSGELPVIQLPGSFPRPLVTDFNGARIGFSLDLEASQRVRLFAAKMECTAYMVLLAMFKIFLHKITGENDIIVGTPIAGRRNLELEQMVGLFVNTLPIRTAPRGSVTVEEYVQEVREKCIKALENQDYPFEDMVEEFVTKRDMGRNPIFDVMFTYKSQGDTATELKTHSITPFSQSVLLISKFDLTLNVNEQDNQFFFSIEYRTGLFKKTDAEQFARCITSVFNTVLNDSKQKLSDVQLLTLQESKTLLQVLRGHSSKPDVLVLYHWLEEASRKTPHKIAVTVNHQAFSFRTINEMSNGLANRLLENKVGNESIVGLLLERSELMIVSIFGVLKTGAAYLPIDLHTPADRVEFMLNDCRANMIITQGPLDEAILYNGHVIDLIQNPIVPSTENLQNEVSPDTLAYVMYTSGTTGRPKGIMIEHSAVISRLQWINRWYPLSDSDKILFKTPYTFDVSVWEIFWWSLNGSCLSILADGDEKDPEKLLEAIYRYKIGVINFVPSMLKAFLAYCENDHLEAQLRSLKRVIASGEILSVALVKEFSRVFEKNQCPAQISNLYGPTEATIDVSFYDCVFSEEEQDFISIGKPVDNVALTIHNESYHLQPIGVFGEICISGSGLARGYMNNPELTATRFRITEATGNNRLYCTGDFGRVLMNGNIEFKGRIDEQVKVRGYRIELADIEANLLLHPKIRMAVVIPNQERDNQTLVAFYEAHENVEVEELKAFLKQKLPLYMIPSQFVYVESFALSASGKINRKMLSIPVIQQDNKWTAPEDKIQLQLSAIWTEILGLKENKISSRDTFFDWGGNSLSIIHLIVQIHKSFSAKLQIRDVFAHADLASMSAIIKSACNESFFEITAYPDAEYYPVSAAQRRFYLLMEMDRSSTAYNMLEVFLLPNDFSVEKIQSVFDQLVRRHESLRTNFMLMNGEVIQKIQEPTPVVLFFEQSSPENIQHTINEFKKPFDLTNDKLIRVGILNSHDASFLMIDLHHIIADANSIRILKDEFTLFYKDVEPEPPRIRYRDFVQWSEGEAVLKVSHEKEYWMERLSGEIPVLELPMDGARPFHQTFEGNMVPFKMDSKLAKKLIEFSRLENGTVFMTLLAAFNILLLKITSQKDIVVGTPVTGRWHSDLSNVVGLFMNMLPMRNCVPDNSSFLEFFKVVKENTIKDFDHQQYAYERVIEALAPVRNLGRNPLFDVMFSLQEYLHTNAKEKDNFGLRPFTALEHTTAKFDLSLYINRHGNHFEGSFEYNSRLFARDTIVSFACLFTRILEAVLNRPHQSIDSIPLLAAHEKQELLNRMSGPLAHFTSQTVHEVFEEQALRYPDRIAISFGNYEMITYREVQSRSTHLAQRLSRKGVAHGDNVCLLMNRSEALVIAVLAVLKCGAAYVPVTLNYPRQRILTILEDCSPALVLTTHEYIGTLEPFAMMYLEDEKSDAWPNAEETIMLKNDVAYILYTSGSTGKPKGVLVKHSSLSNVISSLDELYNRENDRYLLKTISLFDVSATELFGWFYKGGQLVILKEGAEADVDELCRIIDMYGITQINFVPSLFNVFVDLLDPPKIKAIASIKFILLAGEEVDPSSIRKLQEINPGIAIENIYGPTEATIYASRYSLKEWDRVSPIPIGKAMHNMTLLVTDPGGNVVPEGVAGELCIGGKGVSYGYLNQPDLTNEKFVEHPLHPGVKIYRTGDLVKLLKDGNIQFIGRIDQQVKLKGYRIELKEIENHLMSIDHVRRTLVLVRQTKQSVPCLCAYVVSDVKLSSHELADKLGESLPAYMIPSYFVVLEKFPLNASGKIDRNSLPDPFVDDTTNRTIIAPENDMEVLLVRIWGEVLGAEGFVSTTDDFFYLGGDSIKVLQVIAHLYKEGFSVEMKEFFKYTSVRTLAGRISKTLLAVDQQMISGEVNLTPVQKWFFTSYLQNQNHFNQSVMLYRKDGFRLTTVEKSFTSIMQHHDALRMRFVNENGHWKQINSTEDVFDLTFVESEGVGLTSADYAVMDNLQASFNLKKGPLVKLAMFSKKNGEGYLLITIHHLVIDTVSWRILLDDFNTLYNQNEGGTSVQLPPKTEAFQTWSQNILRYSQHADFAKQIQYWSKQNLGGIPVKPNYENGKNLVGDEISVSISVESDITQELLTSVHKAYGTSINDILLSALSIAVYRYSSIMDFSVCMEGHGREEISPPTNVSRTIGWFTSMYPVMLEHNPDVGMGRIIMNTKETMRRIPLNGMGYGIYQYIVRSTPELSNSPLPAMVFNYLGQFGSDVSKLSFDVLKGSTGRMQSLTSERPFLLEMSSYIANNQLEVVIAYSQAQYSQETIGAFLSTWKGALTDIVLHCQSVRERTITPGDFKNTDLTIDELNSIFDK